MSGSGILRVGQQDVLRASHEAVVSAIKTSLEETQGAEGGPSVELKVSHTNMEHLVWSGWGLQWAHSHSFIPRSSMSMRLETTITSRCMNEPWRVPIPFLFQPR